MKKLVICAFVAGIGGPACAQSGFSFDINGQRVHIGVPKNCTDERCISVSTGKPGDRRAPADEQHIDGSQLLDMFGGLMGKHRDDDDEPDAAPPPRRSAAQPPARVPVVPPVPAGPAPVLAPSSPDAGPIAALPPAAVPPAAVPPTVVPPAAPSSPVPAVAAPVAVAPPAPAPVAALPPQEPSPPQEPAPDSPAGIWLTQNSEGRIRIEPCGLNFCGYAVDSRSSHDGEKVLIDMKQVKDRLWKGRVHDPKGGGTYDATMSLKAPDRLGIRGCAMGGFICQGQTWTRG